MEIKSDIALKGTAWDVAIKDENLELFFGQSRRPKIYMLFILAVSIGIMYDKVIKKPEENGEPEHSVPRNVIVNNDNGRLDIMLQAAILSTTTINETEMTEEQRLAIAFGDKTDFNKPEFLTEFANFGITKIVEQLGDGPLQTMDNLKNYLISVKKERQLDLYDITDDLLELD